MRKIVALIMVLALFLNGQAQEASKVKDPEAGALLERASAKYLAQKGLGADFTLTVITPKVKPTDDESKNTTNTPGKLYMKGKKFKIMMNGMEIYCDGKTIWAYSSKNKEVQVNDFEEGNETFSPTKIFSVTKEGYSYQIKEKKNYQGKNVTVIELAPSNKKSSFFKIDVALEDGTNNLLESKVYEKSGVRYIYKMNKIDNGTEIPDSFFAFDSKKYPGVKVVDLR